MIGLTGLLHDDPKRADIFLYGALILAVVLFLSAIFDLTLIHDSQEDNYGLCEIKKTGGQKDLIPQALECSYFRYYITVVLTITSGVCLVRE